MFDKVLGSIILLTFLSVVGIAFYAAPYAVAVFLPVLLCMAGLLFAMIWAMGGYDG